MLLATPAAAPAQHSAARQWNDALLEAIRLDFPAPTVHARNLYHSSSAMWDAWATYDDATRGVYYTTKAPVVGDIAAARNEAISYAAYRVLSDRYTQAVDPVASQAIFDGVMDSLGYDRNNTTTVGHSPAAIGNRIAQQVLGSTLHDGANEANEYVDDTGYVPLNEPMQLDLTGIFPTSPMDEPNHWQPLAFETRITQNDLIAEQVQTFVSPHWGKVTSFALNPAPGQQPWMATDPGPPPLVGGVGDAAFMSNVLDVIRHSAILDPAAATVPFDFATVGLLANQSTTIDMSPASRGNRPPGTHTDQGYALNPATGQPYAPNPVHLADYGRVIAEFWADGPDSETPPGHWFTLANGVADHPQFVKRIGGTGPVVDDLEWDVKTYLALGGAVHDAAVAAWGSKEAYDYVRPISMIRTMGGLGQSSDPQGPSYDPGGLPLEPGLVEVITAETGGPGGRHSHLGNFQGQVVIYAWSGEGEVPDGQVAGSNWIRAVEWWPYQRSTFVTPAFAAYVSGHSTFSRAAAEILAAMTGSEYFPGGLGEYSFSEDQFLDFELGPSDDVVLQWATYYDAADEAGISRLFGGIHVAPDDFAGRLMGSRIGLDAWNQAQTYYVPEPSGLCIALLMAGLGSIRIRT
ncbi:MAG: hypothetical protein CMJ18_15785 [Phycisphaeraceae bacterium]|nr:hypothetical protein [Phycisphaeraceae bacterium]